MMSPLEVRFWGVRGSLPTPGSETQRVGGNTSCVEVKLGRRRIILDAGSGLRALGEAILADPPSEPVVMFLTHVHWDHVMGFPFFGPLYANLPIEVFGAPGALPLREVLERQMCPPLFPIDFRTVGRNVTTHDLGPAPVDFGDVRVSHLLLNHPDPVLAYRIDAAGRSVVFATDTEHVEGRVDPELVAFARGADLLIYDAQYSPEEYRGERGPSRKGWGHSTFEAGAWIARTAGVETLALFHHDPSRTDQGVGELVDRAKALFPRTVAAREGMSLAFDARPPVSIPAAIEPKHAMEPTQGAAPTSR